MASSLDISSAFFSWLHPGATDLDTFWTWAVSIADPRTASWPLLDSITPTVYLTLAYLAFAVIGPVIMRRCSAFDLKPLMIAYNVVVIAINIYMLQGFIVEAYRGEYTWICNPVDTSAAGTGMAWYVYVYYLSKVVDFSDTVFIVLRKKFEQLSFLHVYHHSAMFLIWWVGAKWGNGGDAVFGPMCNSFVHIVMYTYYLGAALKIHIPGKKYLTQLQMIQFFIVVSHSGLNIVLDCPFPWKLQAAQIVFLCSLFALFLNFYVQTYHRGKRTRATESSTKLKTK